MIFGVGQPFFSTFSRGQRCQLVREMLRHSHRIECDGAVRQQLHQDFDRMPEQELLQKSPAFDVTDELRTFLTTIDTTQYSYRQLLDLAHKKARLVIENGPYEWNVHKHLIDAYKHDRQFRNIFLMVERAKCNHDLYCLHAGGVSVMDALIEQEEQENYRDGAFALKHVVIFDHDTSDATTFDPQQNSLLLRLCGKKSDQVTADDVYTVEQPRYHWHIWYKRALENYFRNERYQQLGIDTSALPADDRDRDYCKMSTLLSGYEKRHMTTIARNMSRQEFEQGLQHFNILLGGRAHEVSEMQLLLLKVAKII